MYISETNLEEELDALDVLVLDKLERDDGAVQLGLGQLNVLQHKTNNQYLNKQINILVSHMFNLF